MPAVSPHPADLLRSALAGLVDGLPPRQATAAVERLIRQYRDTSDTRDAPDPRGTSGTPAADSVRAPILRHRADAVAYAAYRMPATFEAATAALTALARRAPHLRPASHLDVGGGTGAALWAAAAVWDNSGDNSGDGSDGNGDGNHPDDRPGGSTGGRAAEPAERTRSTTVLDLAGPALELGRELACAGPAALRGAQWRQQRIAGGAPLPSADLVTVSYLLGELPVGDRGPLVDAAAEAGHSVVLVEPGTPEGYRRIRAARDRLTAAGLHILAPCPHSLRCPIEEGADWCHFAARVGRSSLHRRIKGGSLPYEDEKFSYVAAVRPSPAVPAEGRVVRRPRLRKGQVLLELCDSTGLHRATVAKRQGDRYRAARNTAWGDEWPPPAGTGRRPDGR